jgi:hypothetical protein
LVIVQSRPAGRFDWSADREDLFGHWFAAMPARLPMRIADQERNAPNTHNRENQY